MIKRIFLLLAVFTFTLNVKAQYDALYVYRNDGVINAFLKSNVDSIKQSCIDLDSIIHTDYVVQEVWTTDSVYRIPIEVIDSVGFMTPQTVYKEGTIAINAEMREYILAVDSLTLIFDINTPSDLLPQIGDKLVNVEASGGLNRGFIGKVYSILREENSLAVKCNAIEITDVFECYYGFASNTNNHTNKMKASNVSDGFYSGNFTWEPGVLSRDIFNTYDSSISFEKDGNFLIPSLDKTQCTVSLTPKLDFSSYLIVNRHYGVNLSVSIYGDYKLDEYLAFTGTITGGGDIKFFEKGFPIPAVLCDVNVELGAFMRAGLQLSTEQQWTQRYKSVFHYEWSSKGMQSIRNCNTIRPVDKTHSGIIALKGIFEGGLYGKIGLAFIATSQLDIAEIGVRLEGGLHCEGTAIPYVSNAKDPLKTPDLYNMLKDQGVELSLFYGTSAYANLFSWSWNKQLPNFGNIPFGKKQILKSCYYVPNFENTRLEKDDEDIYYASMKVKERCDKTDIGFSLQRKDYPEDTVNAYCIYDYTGPSSAAYATFYEKPSKEPLVVYPLVKFGELEMIAEPSAMLDNFCPDSNHPHMIDLGLPSGAKWSCCNIGSNNPEDYGSYYSYGETSPKSNYSIDSYSQCYYYEGSWYWNLYGSSKTGIAATQMDAATVNWGESWTTPLYSNFSELFSNCNFSLFNYNGIDGIRITGPNGNAIFFPYSGYKSDDTTLASAQNGYYWAADWGIDETGLVHSNAGWTFTFDLESASMSLLNRYYGFPIRPVYTNNAFAASKSTNYRNEVTSKNDIIVPLKQIEENKIYKQESDSSFVKEKVPLR